MIKNFSTELRDDNDIVKEAVSINGNAIQHASERLRDDIDIATIAVKKNQLSFKYLSSKLRNNKKFILDDVEVTKKALEAPYNFDYISNDFKNDEEIASLVINNLSDEINFPPFKNIGLNLKNNKKFFIKIISKTPYLFQYASNELKEDLDLLEHLLKKLRCKVDYSYSNSKELLEPQIKDFPYFLNFATEEILNDRKIILKAIQKSSSNIQYASEEIKNMLGTNKNQFITRLKKIISIEDLAEKLAEKLDSNTEFNSHKNKI